MKKTFERSDNFVFFCLVASDSFTVLKEKTVRLFKNIFFTSFDLNGKLQFKTDKPVVWKTFKQFLVLLERQTKDLQLIICKVKVGNCSKCGFKRIK